MVVSYSSSPNPPSQPRLVWAFVAGLTSVSFLSMAIVSAPFPPALRVLMGVVLFAGAAAWTRWWVSAVTRPASTRSDEVARLGQRVQELEAQRNQAQAILESMVEGVVALDPEGHILWLNGSAQRLFNTQPSQAMGKRLMEIFRHPDVDALISESLGGGRLAAREIQAFAPTERVIRFQAAPCEGSAALVLVVQDVTEIRRLEGMRREFVANVSHELKTPLTSIKGLVETLLSGALEDPANNRRFVSMIDEDATRLSRLIDDLLELSQIESKAVAMKLQSVPLRPLLESLLPSFRQQLGEHRVTLDLAISADLPPIRGDPERLRQIFINLLDNAVKFNTPGGRITVRAQADGAVLRVDVEDAGIGIPEPDLPRIFERFYRVDKARSRALGGTGLGLSIVKHLVELHLGTINVRSRVNHGSTFTMTFPISTV